MLNTDFLFDMRFHASALLLFALYIEGVDCAILDASSRASPATALEPVGWRQTANACSQDVLSGLSPSARALAVRQPFADVAHEYFTPRLFTGEYERIPELGQVVLGERISRNRYSTVFRLQSHPEYVIKYQSNCRSLDRAVHPLLMDFWLGRIAAEVNVSANPIFVSPAVALEDAPFMTPKIAFRMNQLDLDMCRTQGGVVRFMVMERLVTCLSGTVTAKPNLHLGVQVGIQMMVILHQLHNAGVYHGDIHAGNVCQSRTDPGILKLIDFGTGGFVEEETEIRDRGPLRSHAAMTEWQMDGHSSTRRDDMYKAMELVAFIAVGHSWWTLPELWAQFDRPKLIAWKQRGSLFLTDKVDAVKNGTSLSEEDQDWVRATLDGAVDTVRRLARVEQWMPYGKIQADFIVVSHVLDGTWVLREQTSLVTTIMPTTTTTITTTTTTTTTSVTTTSTMSRRNKTRTPTTTTSTTSQAPLGSRSAVSAGGTRRRSQRRPQAPRTRRAEQGQNAMAVPRLWAFIYWILRFFGW